MSTSFDKAVRAIPELEECVKDLIAVSEELLKLPKGGVAQTMSLAALMRGVEHSKSILKLSDSIDAWLIARSMLEGAALISWLTNDPSLREERAKKWSDGAHHEALVLWAAADKYIRPTMSKARAYATQRVKDSKLSGDKLKENILSGEKEDFLFVKLLTGQTIKELIKSIPGAGEQIYAFHYRMFTGFHHWNPFLFDADDRGTHLTPRSSGKEEYYLALSVAVACLEIFAMGVDAYTGGSMLPMLDVIEARYHAALDLKG